MSMATLKSVMDGSIRGKYAVGAFNFNGIEDARGILDAAQEKNSPIILMASVSAVEYFGADGIGAYIGGLAKNMDIPVVLHLDHCKDLKLIKQCVDSGFTSVMIDASAKSYEENIAISREVVKYAMRAGVSVEAELGKIGGREENIHVEGREAMMTNPDDVAEFVERTGIDALAVAIGTAHGFYKEKPQLDFQRLEKIRALTSAALVLHGGTGVPEADFVKAISLGMNKINVGTELKYACSQGVRDMAAEHPDEIDIRKLAGPNRQKCKEIVLHKIDLFGSADKKDF